MMVLGPEKGIELAKTVGVDVMFLDLTKDGMLTEQSIGVFAAEQASPTKNP
jgi:hypothetical protein